MSVDQLRNVLVAGRDHHVPAQRLCLSGIGANDVVSLDSGKNDQWQSHCLDDVVHWHNLRAQFIRHRRAICFVLSVEVIAKRLAAGIEHHGNRTIRIVLLQLAQH